MITQLEWHQPLWLLLMLQPFLMRALLYFRRRKILTYAEPHLLPWAVLDAQTHKTSKWHDLLNFFFWFLLALAAAGPRIPATDALKDAAPAFEHDITRRQDVGVMVLLNVSSNMVGNENSLGLARAKLELYDFLKRLRGDRIGLIIFSGEAGLMLPPTRDYQLFAHFLQRAGPQLIEVSGQEIGKALQLATKTLVDLKYRSKAVLLLSDDNPATLSDEAGARALQAAQHLKQQGGELFILGFGTAQKEGRLAELASLTQGKYVAVKDGDRDWEWLYDQGIGKLPSAIRPQLSAQNWQPLYRWFLIPALLILLWRLLPFKHAASPLVVTLALVLLIAPPDSIAASIPQRVAFDALQAKEYARAQVLYSALPGFEGRMGEGAAAYRRRDFAYAGKQFSLALLSAHDQNQRADALFNLANSAFMASNFRVAADAYLGVMRYRPNDTQAQTNLAITAGKLGLQRQAGKPTQGIPGRRGMQVGGNINEDISDRPVSMEADPKDDKLRAKTVSEANRRVAAGDALAAALGASDSSATRIDFGTNIAFRAAAKKLEYVEDKPDALLKSLIKHEAYEASK